MATPIKLRINVTSILKEHLFDGKNGKYLNIAIFPNKNGRGQFGDTHFAVQDVSKEAREAGVKGPIIGNLTMPEDEPQRPAQKPQQRQEYRREEKRDVGGSDFSEEEIPFNYPIYTKLWFC